MCSGTKAFGEITAKNNEEGVCRKHTFPSFYTDYINLWLRRPILLFILHSFGFITWRENEMGAGAYAGFR